VRYHQGEKTRIRLEKAGHVRQQCGRIGISRVERQAQVEQNAAALTGQLDAGAANLLRSAMDTYAERVFGSERLGGARKINRSHSLVLWVAWDGRGSCCLHAGVKKQRILKLAEA
jgi:hypothetical protein